MALRTEQYVMLNTLMYLRDNQSAENYEQLTIGEWIQDISVSGLREYGFITKNEWNQILQAVKSDETLCNMKIAAADMDPVSGENGGFSAVFISEETGEAVLAFRGTETNEEWSDNFKGGNIPDTPQQESAMEWYREVYSECGLDQYSVTLSGHSKGGNKAKYITLVESRYGMNTVDRCVSIDGQGFSDEFYAKYGAEIAQNSHKIENHNAESDYVNLLLSDVGERHYYQTDSHGEEYSFLHNHSIDSLLSIDENSGSYGMTLAPNGQSEAMKAADQFLNGMLRTGSETQQTLLLNFITDAFLATRSKSKNGASIGSYIDLLQKPENRQAMSYMLAYTIRYGREKPELLDYVVSVMQDYGLGEFTKFVDIYEQISNDGLQLLEIEVFGKKLVDIDISMDNLIGGLGALYALPDSALEAANLLIQKIFGIKLSKEQLRMLLQVLLMTRINLNRIEISDNGADLYIEPIHTADTDAAEYQDYPYSTKRCQFRVDVQQLRNVNDSLRVVEQSLMQLQDQLNTVTNRVDYVHLSKLALRGRLRKICRDLEHDREVARLLNETIAETSALYENTEKALLSASV